MKLHHFGIEVSNLDLSIRFYTEKLGFEISVPKSTEQEGNILYANLTCGNSVSIELIENFNNKKNSLIKKIASIMSTYCNGNGQL